MYIGDIFDLSKFPKGKESIRENSWSSENNAWSSGQDQWTKESVSVAGLKTYREVEPYKNYKIFVSKQPYNQSGKYIAYSEIGRTEIKDIGKSPEEAIAAIHAKIDTALNAAKVEDSATLDFNVKFATDILGDPRQPFFAKVINVGGEPKLVIAGKEMLDFGRELTQLGFKPSALRVNPESDRAHALPGISYSKNQIAGTGLIANGRYELGSAQQDQDGNTVYDLVYHSTAHTKSDKMRLNKPAFTVGTARSTDESSNDPVAMDSTSPIHGESVDPARKKLGNIINKCFGKIYNYGDNGLEHLDRAAPIWFDLFSDDQYGNDIDTIVANAPIELLKKSAEELIAVLDDLKSGMYESESQLSELSPETLASYKKKAGASATAADKAGDYDKGVAEWVTPGKPGVFLPGHPHTPKDNTKWVILYKTKIDGAKAVAVEGDTEEQARKNLLAQVPNAKIVSIKPKGVKEAGNPAQQAAIAIAMKKAHKKPKHVDEGSTVAYVVTYFDTKTGDRGESTVSALTREEARDKIVQLMHERGYDITVTGVRSSANVDESKEAVFRSHDIEVEYPEGKGHSHVYHRREPYRLSSIFSDANSVAARNRRAKISLFVDGEYIPNYEWQEGVDAPNGGIGEGIVDTIRGKNYRRLANRSFDKAMSAQDKASEYDFADPKRFGHEDEFAQQMRKMRQRERKADELGADDFDESATAPIVVPKRRAKEKSKIAVPPTQDKSKNPEDDKYSYEWYKKQGVAEDDVEDFLKAGGKIQYGKPQKGPRRPGLSLASKHIGGGGDKMKASRTGRAANTQGKPVVATESYWDKLQAERSTKLNSLINELKESINK